VFVKGKKDPVRIYELIGGKGDISPRQKQSITIFNRALKCYLNRKWDIALRLFAVLAEREPSDEVTKLYCERCTKRVDSPRG
jgi:adenylate cyclase